MATVSIPVATAGWNVRANNTNTSYRLLYQPKHAHLCLLGRLCTISKHALQVLRICVPATSRTPHSLTVTIKTRGGSWSSTGICYEKTETIKGKRRRGGRKDKRQIWKTLPLSLSSLKDLIKMDLNHLHTPVAAPTSNKLIDHSYRTNRSSEETQTCVNPSFSHETPLDRVT